MAPRRYREQEASVNGEHMGAMKEPLLAPITDSSARQNTGWGLGKKEDWVGSGWVAEEVGWVGVGWAEEKGWVAFLQVSKRAGNFLKSEDVLWWMWLKSSALQRITGCLAPTMAPPQASLPVARTASRLSTPLLLSSTSGT
jgi:hypothetical protein